MNTYRMVSYRKVLLLMAGLLLPFAHGLVSAPLAEYTTSTSAASVVLIEGTSTLHDWTVRGRTIEGSVRSGVDLADLAALAPGEALALEGELAIPSLSLRSFRRGRPYSSRMDAIMHEKLLAEEHPNIRYTLKTIRLKEKASAEAATFDTTGVLTVGGVDKEVALPLKARSLDDASIEFSTKAEFKMSDFDIEPPIALAGTIRTGDDITVNVTWIVSPKAVGEAVAEGNNANN
jgi:hypothetical protein